MCIRDRATRNLEKRTGERGYMEKIVSGGRITQQRTAFPSEAAKAPRTVEKFVRHLFPRASSEKNTSDQAGYFSRKERKRAGL